LFWKNEMKVKVVPYDPAWPREFECEASRIAEVLRNVAIAIHHIGSTAIPGIHAKPIIDILLEISDLPSLDANSAAMMSLGYEAMGEFGIPHRRYFPKNNADGTRTHQVHAFEAGSETAIRHLAFRDYMIAHPMAAHAYGELKQSLARQHPDSIEGYMDGKDAFIKEHETLALAWRQRHALRR
jgi:GrpB-like predicted nucleotidyltransferase (UPF0157 family)